MAKVLNMKLLYKGRFLNYASSDTNIKNKFYIGSDKNIFWQILDNSFPNKHLFISKKGDKFIAHLRKGMDLTVKKGNVELDNSQLKSQKLLNGNDLKLTPDMSGLISLSPDWSIEFGFVDKSTKRLTPEDLRIIKTYGKWAEPSDDVKFTRIFLTLAVIFTLAGLIVFDLMYEPAPIPVITLDDYQATLVTAEVVEEEPEPVKEEPKEEVKTEEKKEVKEKQNAEEVAQAQDEALAADLENFLGDLNFNDEALNTDTNFEGIADVPQSGTIVADVMEGIVAKNLGGNNNQSGSSKATQKAASLFTPDAGGVAVDDAEVTDLGSAFGSAEFDEIASSGSFEMGGIADLGGNLEATKVAKITPAQYKKKLAELKKQTANIKTIEESAVETGEASFSNTSAQGIVRSRVMTYKSRIEKIFNQDFPFDTMYGTLVITLIVTPEEVIAEVTPASGSQFVPKFIQKVQDEIRTWKIPVKETVKYKFSMPFQKQ